MLQTSLAFFSYDLCDLLQKQTNENLTTNKKQKGKKKCSTLTSAWKPPLTFSHLLFYRSGTKWGVFWVCSFHGSLLSSKWTSQSKSELEAVSLFCSSSYTDCILYWVLKKVNKSCLVMVAKQDQEQINHGYVLLSARGEAVDWPRENTVIRASFCCFKLLWQLILLWSPTIWTWFHLCIFLQQW